MPTGWGRTHFPLSTPACTVKNPERHATQDTHQGGTSSTGNDIPQMTQPQGQRP